MPDTSTYTQPNDFPPETDTGLPAEIEEFTIKGEALADAAAKAGLIDESQKDDFITDLKTVATWTTTGASIGSVIPGVGTVIGAAAGAVIGAIAGFGDDLWDFICNIFGISSPPPTLGKRVFTAHHLRAYFWVLTGARIGTTDREMGDNVWISLKRWNITYGHTLAGVPDKDGLVWSPRWGFAFREYTEAGPESYYITAIKPPLIGERLGELAQDLMSTEIPDPEVDPPSVVRNFEKRVYSRLASCIMRRRDVSKQAGISQFLPVLLGFLALRRS